MPACSRDEERDAGMLSYTTVDAGMLSYTTVDAGMLL